MALSIVIVFELSVSAVRRIFWPQDQDLMQEAEKYAGVLNAMKEHAAETGEAGAAATDGGGKRTSRDSLADGPRPSQQQQQQQNEWGDHGAGRPAKRRSRKISGDVYGAPAFTATPEERDVNPLEDLDAGAGSPRHKAKGKQPTVSTGAYQVGE